MAKIKLDIPDTVDIKRNQKKEGKVVFSFSKWRQQEYFGCDKEDTKWFISLLDRIKDGAVPDNLKQLLFC